MATVEVLDVSLPSEKPEVLWDFWVDAPAAGTKRDVFALHLSGWVLARNAQPVGVNVIYHDAIIRTLRFDYPRPGLAVTHPQVANEKTCGFDGVVGIVGLDPEFELELWVALEDGGHVRFASIRARHEPLRSAHEPQLQPIILNSLPRTGTTRMMEILAAHPEIVVYRHYPYEYNSAQYWAHVVKILSEPENAVQSSRRGDFHANMWWVGHNPFYDRHIDENEQLAQWFGRTYQERLATFCHSNMDDWYVTLARSQDKNNPAYFAEKYRPGHIPALMWDLYPKAKEIFLVRDFRDMACSVFDFWRDEPDATSRRRARSDEDYIAWLAGSANDLHHDWEIRRDRAHLVKYEDMILRPEETLSTLLEYLELDAADRVVEGLVSRGDKEKSQFEQHRTSASAEASIGRHERDLNGSLKQACEEAFKDTLGAFGYAA